jgi:hypothetical protein
VRISIRGALAPFCFALAMVTFAVLLSSAFAAELDATTLPGAWSSVSHRDEQVIRVAKFAVLEQTRQSGSELKLLSVKHARHQLVAGSNFSMNLMVQSDGKRQLAIAVVWVKLNGSMELTHWHWV